MLEDNKNWITPVCNVKTGKNTFLSNPRKWLICKIYSCSQPSLEKQIQFPDFPWWTGTHMYNYIPEIPSRKLGCNWVVLCMYTISFKQSKLSLTHKMVCIPHSTSTIWSAYLPESSSIFSKVRATAKYGTLESDEHVVSRQSIQAERFFTFTVFSWLSRLAQLAISATAEWALIQCYQNCMKATAGRTKVRDAMVGRLTLLQIGRHKANRTKILKKIYLGNKQEWCIFSTLWS